MDNYREKIIRIVERELKRTEEYEDLAADADDDAKKAYD